MVVAKVPSAEAAGAEVPSTDVATAESPLAALTGRPFVVAAMPSLAAMVPVEPPLVTPRRPSGIIIRSVSVLAVIQEPLGEDEIAVVEPLATATSILTPTSSVMTELEGCSSVSAPLDEDSRAAAERLREFLFLGVHEMTTAEAFMEFRSCLVTAMALARRDLILQRRDGAIAVGTKLKSSARQILKAATEKKRALAKRKLIRARWQADIDDGDIAWRRITCLIWGMFSERV
ncbi:unnamed protein product [Prunus brigantina]